MKSFNDFMTNAKSVAESATQKITDCYDLTKLKMTKSKISADLEKAYAQLGKKFYEAENTKCTDSEDKECKADFSAEFAEIASLRTDLDNIMYQIAMAKDMKACPVCSSLTEKDAKFCSKCGNKF